MCKLVLKDKQTNEVLASAKMRSQEYAENAKALIERYVDVKVEIENTKQKEKQ